MAAPSKSFTTVPDSAIDADSPWHEDIVEDFRDNDIFLQEVLGDTVLYGAFQQQHAHTGSDGSAPIPGASGGKNLVVGKIVAPNNPNGLQFGQITANFRPQFAMTWAENTFVTTFASYKTQHVTGTVATTITAELDGTPTTAGKGATDLSFGGLHLGSQVGSNGSEGVNFMQMQSESTYIDIAGFSGDGLGSQIINIPFQADLILVLGGGFASGNAIRTSGFSTTNSRRMDGVWLAADGIVDISATSFTVASNLNITGRSYHFVAIKSDITVAGERMELESYTGNGAASQSTDVDLTAAADGPPQACIIVNTNNTGTRVPNLGSQTTRLNNIPASINFAQQIGGIIEFLATGVVVDTGSDVNANTEEYDIAYFFGGRL